MPELLSENAEHYKLSLIEASFIAEKMNMPLFARMLLTSAGVDKKEARTYIKAYPREAKRSKE
jgi:hypothetical protein